LGKALQTLALTALPGQGFVENKGRHPYACPRPGSSQRRPQWLMGVSQHVFDSQCHTAPLQAAHQQNIV
jgi:hypothetical protein